ncbi:MAG: transposase [Muribaculaceae bacterium]|nr:transposase [Muribaculaceae bacterium]
MALTAKQKQWLDNHPELRPRYSMKRRCEFHDYTSRSIYMITIAVEGRHPILGTLCGPDGNHHMPRVEASPVGEIVKEIWNNIPKYYQQIKPIRLQLMPDHMHGILFVTQPMNKHLGHVIKGFKAGCNKAFRELSATMSPITTTSQPTHLWEEGYHDRILTGDNQLKKMIDYLIDNPRRLWIKQNNPDYFKTYHNITIADQQVSAMGNIFLLHAPNKVAVKVSRDITDEQLDIKTNQLIKMAQQGTILVSPCISKGEKHIFRIAYEMGYSTIVIQENGFSKFAKPTGKRFNACAQGKLLIIATGQHHNQTIPHTREISNKLNHLAAIIATTI